MPLRKIGLLTLAVSAGVGWWPIGSKAEPRVPAATELATAEAGQSRLFLKNLPSGFIPPTDDAGRLLLREYGAVFLARGGVKPPKKVVYEDEADVAAFQTSVVRVSEKFGSNLVVLQQGAMEALLKARAQARASGLNVSPRGADSARRGYAQTVSLWASRVNPGLAYWTAKGRVSKTEAARIKSLTPYEQVPEILRLERDKIFFAKTLDKSIIYSVAPPGTSQHLSMLALDVAEFESAAVRAILAQHGWFQTVLSDLPHFTYLGVKEAELPKLGLRMERNAGRNFWVPDF
jgi:hypothetical protein